MYLFRRLGIGLSYELQSRLFEIDSVRFVQRPGAWGMPIRSSLR